MTSSEARAFTGRTLHAGQAEAPVLALSEPLSFWGGTDHTGRIIDRHHREHGRSVAGQALAMTSGRGSSSSSYVLAEQLRVGSGPAAILLAEADAIIALGAIVADEMYRRSAPVVCLAPADLASLRTGQLVRVSAGEEEARVEILG